MGKGLLKIETDQYMKVIDSDRDDKIKFNKIAGPGDELRGIVSSSFLTDPDEMRKHLRKKKSDKPKTKRKCRCK